MRDGEVACACLARSINTGGAASYSCLSERRNNIPRRRTDEVRSPHVAAHD